MEFPFTYDVKVGDVVVDEIEGRLSLGFAPEGASLSGRFADWMVEEVVLKGARRVTGPDKDKRCWEQCEVVLADDHWLYARLLADILTNRKHAIDEAWERDRERQGRGRLRLVS